MPRRSEKASREPRKTDRKMATRAPVPNPTDRQLGEVGVSGIANAALLASAFNQPMLGDLPFDGVVQALIDLSFSVSQGDLNAQRGTLASQAVVLDRIFAEMARRAAVNMGHSLEVTEAYMRIALKAQSQCRATIETLDRVTNGREQAIRRVHFDNRGGQAIFAENLRAGESQNVELPEQPHAQRALGSPLPCQNPRGHAVSVARNQGQGSLPDARGKRKRRALREP